MARDCPDPERQQNDPRAPHLQINLLAAPLDRDSSHPNNQGGTGMGPPSSARSLFILAEISREREAESSHSLPVSLRTESTGAPSDPAQPGAD